MQGAAYINASSRAGWIAASGLMVLVLAAGCRGRAPVAQPTAVPGPTRTPQPTLVPARPTDPPPGTVANPLNLYLVAPGDPSNYTSDVAAISEALSGATGLVVEVSVTDSYAPVLSGLCDRSVHMGMLDAFSYLAASERGCVTPVSVAERDGDTAVQGQLIANTQAFVTDVTRIQGRRFCRTGGDSAYGWVVPSLTLLANGIDPLNQLDTVIDAGDDEGVVRQVHDRECDVGATLLGAEEDVKDLQTPQLVSVVEALAPIPNEVLVFGSAASEPVREASREAFGASEGALVDVMAADALQVARDSDYDALRAIFAAADVDVVALAR